MVAPSIFKPFFRSPRKVHGVHARDILDASLLLYMQSAIQFLYSWFSCDVIIFQNQKKSIFVKF